MEQRIIRYPTAKPPSTVLNSIFMSTVNTAAKTLLSVASTGRGVQKWGVRDHLRYMIMFWTWITVWLLRVLMDYLPLNFLPSPQYFLSGGGFMSLLLGSSSSPSSTSTDLVVHNGFGAPPDGHGHPIDRALSHIFTLVNELPVSSRKYQFAVALAENIVDENVRDGHEALQEINRTALSSAFGNTTSLLHQSLQAQKAGETDSWPSRLLYSLPLGFYLKIYLKGVRFVTSLLPIGNKNTGSNGGEAYESVKSEKFAQELLWVTKKLKYCGAIDEALLHWSFASGLASISLMANPRVQGTILRISAILIRELAQGGMEIPSQVKFRMLVLWLPLLCYASNGLSYPVLTGIEKAETERAIAEVISTLPVYDQEIVLTNWLQDFIYSNSDWPNLQKSYERWCRISRKLIM